MAAAAAIILLLTLTPLRSGDISSRGIAAVLRSWNLADAINNLLLFLPFGIAAAFWRPDWKSPVLLAAGLSAAVELAQLAIPGRFSSIFDVAANTAGAAGGIALVRYAPVWVRLPRHRARLAGAAAAAAALFVLIGGVALFRQSVPRGLVLLGRHTVRYSHMEPYEGRVLGARVDGIRIPSTWVPESDRLRRRLLDGEPLRVDFIAGPPPSGPAAIFNLVDARRRDVIQIAADSVDLLVSIRTHGAALGLNAPRARIEGALRMARPGDRVSVEVRPQGSGMCVAIGTTLHCYRGPAVGETWRLLLHPVPDRLALALSIVWIAVLFMPAGFWLPSVLEVVGAGVVVSAALVMVPQMTAGQPTPTGQILAVWAGLVVGWLVQRVALRAAPPARHAEPTVAEGI